MESNIGRLLTCKRCGKTVLEEIVTSFPHKDDLDNDENFKLNKDWNMVNLSTRLSNVRSGEWVRVCREFNIRLYENYFLCPDCQKWYMEKENSFLNEIRNELKLPMKQK